MPRETPALPSATRHPAAARQCHGCPTKQPSVSPAKEEAPPPNSASGEREKVPSRRRHGGASPGQGGLPKKLAGVFPPGKIGCVPCFGFLFAWSRYFSGDVTLSPPPGDSKGSLPGVAINQYPSFGSAVESSTLEATKVGSSPPFFALL